MRKRDFQGMSAPTILRGCPMAPAAFRGDASRVREREASRASPAPGNWLSFFQKGREMRRPSLYAFALACLIGSMPAPALAQTAVSGSIAGVARDTTGAVL